MSVVLSYRAYLVDGRTPGSPGGSGLRGHLRHTRARTLRTMLRTDRGASTLPWLGGGPVTVIDDGGVQEKVTIVVLADGYGATGRAAFAADTDRLIHGLFALDFFAANRANFRVVRVGLVSADDAAAQPTVPRDTAIGLVCNDDWNSRWFDPYTAENFWRIRKALRIWRLDGDVVVVLAHHQGQGGLWNNRMMALTSRMSPGVFAHELGHTFGMLDEYVQQPNDETYGGPEPDAPNLTIETDRAELAKWGSLIAPATPVPTPMPAPAGWRSAEDVGLFQGGWGRYTKGVYRPSDQCRMNEGTRFCRVCARAMGESLRHAIDHEGRPVGAGDPSPAFVKITLRRQPDGSQEIVDMAPTHRAALSPPPMPGAVAIAAWNGDELLAAAHAPTAIPPHGFGGDAPGSPHAFAGTDLDEVEIRIPAARLDGVDIDELTVGLVRLARSDVRPVAPATWRDAVSDPSSAAVTARLRPAVSARADLGSFLVERRFRSPQG